jgi:hypothetical protein
MLLFETDDPRLSGDWRGAAPNHERRTERATRSDRRIASQERKCQTSDKEVIMTNEQTKALAAVRAAFVAAETTGLSEAEICKAAVNGLDLTEVKSGRPPGNYNPIADGPDKQKGKAQHG